MRRRPGGVHRGSGPAGIRCAPGRALTAPTALEIAPPRSDRAARELEHAPDRTERYPHDS